jgi:hypothetical protein
MANARVLNEEIFYRDPNIRHVESTLSTGLEDQASLMVS